MRRDIRSLDLFQMHHTLCFTTWQKCLFEHSVSVSWKDPAMPWLLHKVYSFTSDPHLPIDRSSATDWTETMWTFLSTNPQLWNCGRMFCSNWVFRTTLSLRYRDGDVLYSLRLGGYIITLTWNLMTTIKVRHGVAEPKSKLQYLNNSRWPIKIILEYLDIVYVLCK